MTDIASISSSDARRAARNVSALVFASLISKGALFFWQLWLSTWLGAYEYGIYGAVGGMIAIAGSLASFSMGLIVIRDVALEPRKAGKYWTAMLFWQTALALLAYIAMNGFAVGYSEALRGFAALAGINLFVDLFGNMGHDLLLAREDMLKTSLVEIVHILLRIGLALAALTLGFGLLGVYGAAIISGILRSMTLVYLNFRAGTRPQFPFDRTIGWPLLVNSAPLALSAFLSLAYQHADKLMTTGILGETVTGYLTIAFVINFGVIELFSTTVLVAAYPLLARYYNGGGNSAFGYIIEKLALYMMLIGLPLALSLSIFAEDLVLALFGSVYAPTAGILSLLIWYTAIAMFGNVFSKGMLIQNRQRRLLALRAAGLALNVALNAILLTAWGDARGAAIASIAAELLVVILLLRSFRASGCQWGRLGAGAARLLLIAVPVALIMFFARGWLFVPALLIGISAYLIGILLARVFNDDDWDLIYRLTAAAPGGTMITRYWRRDVDLSW